MALPLRDDLPTRRFPWVTLALITINVVVFLFVQPSAFQNPPHGDTTSFRELERQRDANSFIFTWGAVPCELLSGERLADGPSGCRTTPPVSLPTDKSVYATLLTCMFLHGGVEHIAGNMLFLWVFGNNVEDRLGWARYLALYLVGGVVATLGFAAFNQHTSEPLVGASGAIAAVMGAYLVFHPKGRILTVIATAAFQVVYVPAIVVLALFFVTQFATPDNEVAWEAHVAGMVFGVVAAFALGLLPSVRRQAALDRADVALRAGADF
ncbi:rhomboid family intramembrane serine protease [Aquihabitans sp. G128]|uniref:rhomboid family intramembrane serine protease n=1 Tax=Aquihabitans sp. G128 TaxID=2849779 RepID=UPI001C22B61E|nr:rhomboid family intramembrane serine protease [Aquihabitans sp. G128]QXC62162.1 rhomboid family intramembrane serine protease [Aquihabitans sp. G128]